MKKSAILGIVAIIIIVLISGFIFLNKPKNDATQNLSDSVQSDGKNNIMEDTKTSIHKDFRAIIKSDWQELEVPPSTFVYLPRNTDQEDVEAEVISVTTAFLGENNEFTLDQLLKQGVENSKKIIPDFELTETVIWEGSSLQGKKIKFTGTQESIKRESVQVFGIKYNILYAITYSCPIGKCNYHGIFNNLAETFEPVEPKLR